jgi:SAM-dependent methyltransferase
VAGVRPLDLARAVAPDGTVVGVDLSAAVLAFAQRAAKGCERVRFVQADAQVFPFEPASFDAAFSRFGVMFFADPTAAFINIRRGLRPNGRLAFVCWRALEGNPLDIVPLRAASAHLPPQPAHDPDAPGPFAFANPDRVRGILERASFEEIEITARDEQVGSGDLDTMLAICSRVGALGKILRENPELRAATLPAVRSALAAHDGPDGVRLNAATWVVTARAPAQLPLAPCTHSEKATRSVAPRQVTRYANFGSRRFIRSFVVTNEQRASSAVCSASCPRIRPRR